MVYVGENVYKSTLYLCNVSKFKKCRKKGCNFYTVSEIQKKIYAVDDIDGRTYHIAFY